jgi:hypothetical protein
MTTGSYVGDGSASRSIGGLGFQPDIVIIKVDYSDLVNSNLSSAVMRTSSMSGDNTKPLKGGQALTSGLILSLDVDGFTVGSDLRVNDATTCGGPCTYYWVAFKAGSNTKVGSYTGDGGASQDVTAGFTFSPEYVIVMPANTQRATHRSYLFGVNSNPFNAGGPELDSITALLANGFQVGSTYVNTSSVSYHYVAWNEAPGWMKVGGYLGDDGDNRSIGSVGFQPEYMIVQAASTGRDPIQRTDAMVGDASVNFRDALNANRIQALEVDGFQVGSYTAVNAAPEDFYYVAFNKTTSPSPTATPTNTPTPTPTSGGPAPAVDAVSAGDTRPATLTISHTTGSGADRLMLVGISFVNDELETVSSVTYNGVALTLVGSVASSDDARVEIWRLIAPPSGTYNVVITFSAPLARAAEAGVMTFTGVHQTTPLGTFASASLQCTAPCADPSVNVTSAVNELVFDTVACETCTSFTVGAGQTQRWNLAPLDGPRPSPGAGSTEPGAATVTMSWTVGTDDHWAIGGVSIKPSGGSAPVVDSTSSGRTPPRTSLTISHPTAGSNRLMLVGVSVHNFAGETVSSISYNGVALTQVGSSTNATDARVEIWRLIAPPTGTYDVVITFNAELSSVARAGVMTFTGVNQTTPLGTFASATGSASPATVNVTSAANELVFDTVGSESQSSPFSLTVGAGQTERWNSVIMGYDRFLAAGSTEPGAASVTMSWTIVPASSVPWAIGAVPIKP